MTEQLIRRADALRQITAEGIEGVLTPAGFDRQGKLSWVRQAAELHHVIAVLARRGMYDIQWGIVSPETVPYLWGTAARLGDVGQAIVSGTPGSIHHPPACQSFRLAPTVSEATVRTIVTGVATDLSRVERRLREFSTRLDVRRYLLLNRDPKDRRDFVVPANLPLKLFTAASLALVDADPAACDLVADAERHMAKFRDELTIVRLQRLRQGSEELCG